MESKVFNQTQCHTITADTAQLEKEALFHRNISGFRESFSANNTSVLPFLASLRQIKDYRQL
jgi:hypothetical protein